MIVVGNDINPILTYLDVEKDETYNYFKETILDKMEELIDDAYLLDKLHIVRVMEIPNDIDFDKLKWHIKTVGDYKKDGKKLTITFDINKIKRRYLEEKELKEKIDDYFLFINNIIVPLLTDGEVVVPIIEEEHRNFVEIPHSNLNVIPLWEITRYLSLVPGIEFLEEILSESKSLKIKVINKDKLSEFYVENFKKLGEKQKKF